ncbi:hypothetical protein LUZ60_007084 [Juncus effusus]|nr:hypothetical protein LUZ60_007084 [Juncus effusus]
MRLRVETRTSRKAGSILIQSKKIVEDLGIAPVGSIDKHPSKTSPPPAANNSDQNRNLTTQRKRRRRASEMNKDKVFKLAKGFRGRAKNCIRIARERVEKALQYSYRDRRNKKRDMRSLWIERINAGSRLHGVNYGNFIHGLMKENVQLNRKVLSELAMHEPYSFKVLVDVSRNAFPGNKPIVPKKEGLSSIL